MHSVTVDLEPKCPGADHTLCKADICEPDAITYLPETLTLCCAHMLMLLQPEVARLFLRHCQQLPEQCPDSLPLLRAQWLFALAARLEKPCHAEVAAGFRSLLRHCCKLRAGVSHDADPLLPKLNVLIVMAGAYFAQDEHLCSVVDSSELL